MVPQQTGQQLQPVMQQTHVIQQQPIVQQQQIMQQPQQQPQQQMIQQQQLVQQQIQPQLVQQGGLLPPPKVLPIPAQPPTAEPPQENLVPRARLLELVREIDSLQQMDEEVEEALLALADDFIESAVEATCRVAKHRGGRSPGVGDLQLYLERTWHMHIPGFGTEELRPYKRAPSTEAHKQRLAIIRKAVRKY